MSKRLAYGQRLLFDAQLSLSAHASPNEILVEPAFGILIQTFSDEGPMTKQPCLLSVAVWDAASAQKLTVRWPFFVEIPTRRLSSLERSLHSFPAGCGGTGALVRQVLQTTALLRQPRWAQTCATYHITAR